MAELPVVRVDTLEDLKRVLFIQRQITRRAHDELEAVASDNLLEANTDPDIAKVKKYMKEEGELLADYAMRPTLSEWVQQGGFEQPGFYEGASTWGASFAVAILTGELILEQIRQMHPQFVPAIKGVFMSLLITESQAKGHMDEGEFHDAIMKFHITKSDGTPLEDETIKEKIRVALLDVVKTMVATGIEYGLFEECDSGSHLLTEVGTRIMLHMQDVQKFVAIMAEAHKRFQNVSPTLMASLATPERPPRRKKRVKPTNPTI